MALVEKTELRMEHTFDPLRNRHYVNGALSVLHCHHFTTLYSQLADDAELFDGKKMLFAAAEETFLPLLKEYYQKHGLASVTDRVAIAEQYYGAVGMGLMRVTAVGRISGCVELLRSHLDEGWKAKWGGRPAPVNFITAGYIAAVFSAIYDLPAASFEVTEEQSIVAGAETSVFRVVRK